MLSAAALDGAHVRLARHSREMCVYNACTEMTHDLIVFIMISQRRRTITYRQTSMTTTVSVKQLSGRTLPRGISPRPPLTVYTIEVTSDQHLEG